MVRPKPKKRVKFVKTPIVWKTDVSRDELDIKPEAYPPHHRHMITTPAWAHNPPQLGQLFSTTTSLWVRDTQYERKYYTQFYLKKTFIDFKFPMVTNTVSFQANWDAAPIPAGSMAMYAGTFHVSETIIGNNTEMRTLCHSFIINGARYVLNDLNWVKPI